MNLNKSQVFFSGNVDDAKASALSNSLGIAKTNDLGRYLGVPLLHHRASKSTYSFILEKMRGKISSWKSASLSFAGRVTLAQSSLASILGYAMQTTPLPISVIDEAERICRDFIWGSSPTAQKCHLISWRHLCRNLQDLNDAYMMKNDWQLVAHPKKIWVQVLRIKYKVGLHLMPDVNPSTRLSLIWRAICKVWPSVFHNIGWVVNNGEWVRFWKDAWIPGMRDLESTFPQIVPPGEDHFPVSYDVHDREWKWDTLQRFLPGHVCTLIASTNPPQPPGGSDGYSYLVSLSGWHFHAEVCLYSLTVFGG